jgi:dienelactone hydrolase
MPRVLLATVLASALLAAPASATVRHGPSGLHFYKPTKHLHGHHGRLYWWRAEKGNDALKGAKRNLLILYRSSGGSGPLVSGSVAVPKGKTPKGGWPVIAYAHGTTGIADACAPTRGYDADDLNSYAFPLLQRWLKAGFAVVRTDYNGLGTRGVHEYLFGRAEGRSVLDSVLAARRLLPRTLAKRYVIAGHSQGGHAALFAAAAAPHYAPGLRLRGTVAFAPASHLKTQFQAIMNIAQPGGGLGSIVALGLRSQNTAYPGLHVTSLLTQRARALFPQTESRCYDRLSKPDSFGGLPLNEFLDKSKDLTPLLNDLGKSDPEHLRPTTPVRVEQGTADQTVFESFTKQLVDEYKANYVPVVYKTYAGVTHGAIVNAAAADSTKWIRKRLK